MLSETNPLGNTTTYTYYTANYSLPKSKEYYMDAAKIRKISETYELTSGNNNIAARKVLENSILKQHTAYTYNSNGTVATQVEYIPGGAAARTTQFAYQDAIFVKQVVIGGLSQGEKTFDVIGQVTVDKDANGNITRYERDGIGRVVKQTNPDGGVREYFYDVDYWEDVNTVYITDENGYEKYEDYTPLGMEQEQADLTSYVVLNVRYYDTGNRMAQLVNLDASQQYIRSQELFYYDYADRITETFSVNGSNQIAKGEDYEYDNAVNSNMSKITKSVWGSTGAPDINTTEYFDSMDRKVQAGIYIGGVERIDKFTYDNLGNPLTSLTALDASRSVEYTGKFEYDFANRVVKEYQARLSGAAELSAPSTYDSLGNLTRKTDFKGNETLFEHDILGRVTRERNLVSSGVYAVTENEYDNNGNLTLKRVQCNKPGATAQWRRTGYTYDRMNRLADTIYYLDDGSANYTRTRVVYDLMGQVIEQYTGMTSTSTSGAAKKAQTWNHYGKILTKTDSLNRAERYTYGAIGTLLSKVDRNGNTTLYDFDDFGRMTNERTLVGSTITQKAFAYTPMDTVRQGANEICYLTYSYDEAGRLTELVNSAGSIVQYTYDIGGNRTGMVVVRGSTVLMTLAYTYDQMNRMKTVRRDGALLATYDYDANGNRTSKVVNANGTTAAYAYNGVNQVTSLVNKNSAGTTLSTFTYTYYLDGNQAAKVESGKTTEYTYDRMGRLTVEKVSDGNQWTYTFDAFSNRKTMVVAGTAAKSVTYTYDRNNRLLTEVTTGSGAGTRTNTYDNNGNMVTSTAPSGVEQYAYNGFNQLTAALVGGATSQYVYRSDGLRHGKGVAGVTTLATWDGDQLVVDLVGGVPTLYVRSVGLIASVGTATEYFLYNAHGDVVQVVNASGAVQKTYVYDAYGNQMSLAASDANPFRYSGEYYDRESGNIYLRARYYMPRTGRFLTEDVAGDGINWYTYCGGNPVMFVDPKGLATYALGGSTSLAAALKLGSTAQIVVDSHKNVGILIGNSYGGGTPAIDISVTFTATNADNIRDLSGWDYSTGFSVTGNPVPFTPGLGIGVDYITSKDYHGFNINVGAESAPWVEGHAQANHTLVIPVYGFIADIIREEFYEELDRVTQELGEAKIQELLDSLGI